MSAPVTKTAPQATITPKPAPASAAGKGLVCESAEMDRASDTKAILRQNVVLANDDDEHVRLTVHGPLPFLFEKGAEYSIIKVKDAPAEK